MELRGRREENWMRELERGGGKGGFSRMTVSPTATAPALPPQMGEKRGCHQNDSLADGYGCKGQRGQRTDGRCGHDELDDDRAGRDADDCDPAAIDPADVERRRDVRLSAHAAAPLGSSLGLCKDPLPKFPSCNAQVFEKSHTLKAASKSVRASLPTGIVAMSMSSVNRAVTGGGGGGGCGSSSESQLPLAPVDWSCLLPGLCEGVCCSNPLPLAADEPKPSTAAVLLP